MATFNDLPLDILELIFPYLAPSEFLNLCSTCRSLADPSIRNEPTYWKLQTQLTFRVPNRPAVQADGLRWQTLFRKLQTQSRVYTWGQNTHGCLGRGTTDQTYGMQPRRGPHLRPRVVDAPLTLQKSTWPDEVTRARDIGIISDLQCGGWSTSLLTAKGVIYTVGVLDGMLQWNARDELTPLPFDPINNELPKAHTMIKQFSSGRKHVLGLSDDGCVWSWADATRPGVEIKLDGIEGKLQKVCAGWDRSSALVKGIGICLWVPVKPNVNDGNISDVLVVPRTDYALPPKGVKASSLLDDVGEKVGAVLSYIVLEHYVVFTTHLHKIFAYAIHHDASSGVMHDIFELTELSDVRDVQGSFRNFAVFIDHGKVLITNQDYLDACSRQVFQPTLDPEPLPQPLIIPAMQNTGVMQVAFGDYHYHALHSDGSITSYGVEPGSCGALGLGGTMDMRMPHGVLRGIKTNDWNHDGVLLPHCYIRGRRVWFHKEQNAFIRFMATGGKDYEEAQGRMRQVCHVGIAQACVSEWIEQMGGDWEKQESVRQVDDDGLGAYFALSVSAAGWHSGALVLVNDKVVKAVRESCFEDIPKLPEHPVAGRPRSSSLLKTVTDTARSFLGLQVTDPEGNEIEEANGAAPESRPQLHHAISYDGEGPPPGKQWRWLDWDFPRLRLDYGFQTPGTIDFTPWKVQRPDWRFIWTGRSQDKIYHVPEWHDEETDPIEGP